jgi:hypothetical protein
MKSQVMLAAVAVTETNPAADVWKRDPCWWSGRAEDIPNAPVPDNT